MHAAVGCRQTDTGSNGSAVGRGDTVGVGGEGREKLGENERKSGVHSQTEGCKPGRRGFLTQLASGVLVCASGPTFAEELARTPRVEEGPFYPDRLPLDTDNDLIIVNDAITPAVGTVTHLGGRLL